MPNTTHYVKSGNIQNILLMHNGYQLRHKNDLYLFRQNDTMAATIELLMKLYSHNKYKYKYK